MFYERLVALCAEKNTNPTALCDAIGLAQSAATRWKQGSVPRDTTLRKIADYFGVTVDELLAEPAPSPVDEAMAKLTASMQKALDSIEKEKSPLLRSLENLVKNMTQDQQREMKKYAEFLISKNKEE